MASPAEIPNGISTPPTTATGGAQNPSPPTASSTQPNTQQASQINGTSTAAAAAAAAAAAPVPPFPATSLQDPGTSKRPRDARLIHLILAHMGVHAYTERVPLQLLDFAYRYTSSILSDALAYEPPSTTSTHGHGGGGKKGGAGNRDDEGISLAALRTAVGARAAQQFSAVLPKEFMLEVAGERNRVALPRVEREWGLRLPPERYCFTGVGWNVKESWEEEVDGDDDEGEEGVGGPVGGAGVGGDTVMGGMEEEVIDEEEFEEVMGGGDVGMRDG